MNKNTTENSKSDTTPSPSIIARDDSGTIAYDFLPGKSAGIIFFSGLKSDMYGSKATAIHSYCKKTGRAFLRFDYTGHGWSSGKFQDGTIGHWTKDAIFVLDHLTRGPQVLIGSSMGGWIMLLAALQRQERIAGMIGSAAAPDFTEELIWEKLNKSQKQSLEQSKYINLPNCYNPQEPYRISHDLVIEGRNHLLLKNKIPIDVPVRLIHGLKDNEVPFTTSQRLAEKLETEDAEIILVKSGDHRLSGEDDLRRLIKTLSFLLEKIET